MKNYLLLFTIGLLSLNLVSCSEDDDYSKDDLVGVWQLVTESGWYHDENGKKQDHFEEYTDGEFIYEFFEDGSMRIEAFGSTVRGTWEMKGSKMHLTIPSSSMSFKINTLNSSKLVLEENGRDEDGEYFYKTTFKKIG